MKKNIAEIVENFPTKNKEGFTEKEIKDLLKKNFPKITMKMFDKAFGVNTCMIIDNQILMYHCDIITALEELVNNKKQHPLLWD